MRNRLLEALEPDVRSQFDGPIRRERLERGQVIQQQGGEIKKVVFPEDALIGLVNTWQSGTAVQTATVGWEGALGVFEACGSRLNTFDAEVQISGDAWAMPVDDYRRMFETSEGLRVAVHKYVEVVLAEGRQFVACSAVHTVDERLCRLIPEALERTSDQRFLPITHGGFAQMLGVQRTTVTAALSQLQASGALAPRRGGIEILNLDILERYACTCRRILVQTKAEIYGSNAHVCEAEP